MVTDGVTVGLTVTNAVVELDALHDPFCTTAR